MCSEEPANGSSESGIGGAASATEEQRSKRGTQQALVGAFLPAHFHALLFPRLPGPWPVTVRFVSVVINQFLMPAMAVPELLF